MNKIKKIFKMDLTKIDWLILFVIMFGLGITFQQSDLLVTARHGVTMSEGHVFDFYTYLREIGGGASYLPSTYFLFGLWNIPVAISEYITGVPLAEFNLNISRIFFLWNKLLPILFYFASGLYVYKIGILLKMSKTRSKYMCFAFLSAPIALFSQFIFGQYDSFTLFFVLLGVYSFMKEDRLKFLLFFGIAATFKYTSLFIFFPLLFLQYKKIGDIIKNSIIMLIPFLLELVVYGSSLFHGGPQGFATSKLDYITGTSISSPYFTIQITLFLFVILCAFAYFYEIPKKEESKYCVFFYCNCAIFLMFGMSMWHPQWMLLAIPFWTISTFMHKKCDIFLWIDLLMMLFFMAFTVMHSAGFVDQEMLRLGVFGGLLEYHTEGYSTMSSFLPFKDKDMIFTLLSSLMAIQCIFKLPKFSMGKLQDSDTYLPILRTRLYIGIAIFLIPCLLSVVSIFRNNVVPFNTTNEIKTTMSSINSDSNFTDLLDAHSDKPQYELSQIVIKDNAYLEQRFEGKMDIDQILLLVSTVDVTSAKIEMSIDDVNTGETIFTSSEIVEIKNSDVYLELPMKSLTIVSEHIYELKIRINALDDEAITLFLAKPKANIIDKLKVNNNSLNGYLSMKMVKEK